MGFEVKRSFELSRFRRANVWINEVPPAEFMAVSIVRRTLKPKATINATSQKVGVEIYIPHGSKASYGVLGAELVESETDGLEIIVSVNNGGNPFRPSLASKSDEVIVGLLDEYADAVIGGIIKAAEVVGAPTNASLRFRWAAHGLVGSSHSIFESASAIVLQLLLLPKEPSDEQIVALFD